jgi:hypothetical protein
MGRRTRIERMLRLAPLLAALASLISIAYAPAAHAVHLSKTLNHSFRGPFDLPFAGVGGLATSPDGAFVYVGTGAKVIQYTTAGVWVRTWSPVFGRIGGLATDPAGDVFVLDSADGQVQKFDKAEKHLSTWSVPGVQQIAADTHGHVYLLVSLLLGWVVDVRSYAGVEQGAWSVVLPDSFRQVSYTPGTTKAIKTFAADGAGNVFVGGISEQRLEGEGQDCHTLLPKDQYEYRDPLDSGEVARFAGNGAVTGWGWLNTSPRAACYPPFISLGEPLAMAVAPDDGDVWVADYPSFFRNMATQSSSFPVLETLEEPCLACNHPPSPNLEFIGPATFDCHGNLFVGAGEAVLEFIAAPALNDCPSRLAQLGQVTLAPAISLVKPKVKKKQKAQTLDFEAGCTGLRCSIGVLAQARLPRCHAPQHCTIALARGRFLLRAGGGRLSLALTHAGEALLARNPRLPIDLSARVLHKGRPSGPAIHAHGGRPLLALPTAPVGLSCTSPASLGAQIALSGTLGLRGSRSLSLAIGSPAGPTTQELHTNAAGAFALSLDASAAGAWTFSVVYHGDRMHAPSGAGCSTFVPPPPPPASHKTGPPAPAPPPIPIATTLELNCRNKGSEQPFTGAISPTLAEVPITITYRYKSPGGPREELVDHLSTNAAGKFSDKPVGINVDQTGTATASWPGTTGYLGATSAPCSFEP